MVIINSQEREYTLNRHQRRHYLLFLGLLLFPSMMILRDFGLGSSYVYACGFLFLLYAFDAVLRSVVFSSSDGKFRTLNRQFSLLFIISFFVFCLFSLGRSSVGDLGYLESAKNARNMLLISVLPIFAIFAFDSSKNSKKIAFRAMLWGLCSIPFTLFYLDIISGQFSKNLEIFYSGYRVLSTSAISSPNTIAFLFSMSALSAVILIKHRENPFICSISLIISFMYLILVSSKGSLLIAGFIAFTFISKRFLIFSASLLLIIWPFSAVFLTALYSSIEAIGLGSFLFRDGADALGLATGRVETWETALTSLSSQNIETIFLGNGFMGAMGTEVQDHFRFLFRFSEFRERLHGVYSLHNGSLQVLIDQGVFSYLIQAFFLIFLAVSVRKMALKNESGIIFLVFLIVWSMNESVGTIYFVYSVMPFVFIVAYLVSGGEEASN